MSTEPVSGSREVRTLLTAWSVEALVLHPIGDCSVVEHLGRFFLALNQSTKMQFFTAFMSLVRDLVLPVGALMSTQLSSSVILYPLMLHIFQQRSADRLTKRILQWTATLVDHGVKTNFEWRKVP